MKSPSNIGTLGGLRDGGNGIFNGICMKLLPFNIPSLIESNPDSLPVMDKNANKNENEILLCIKNKTHVHFFVHRHLPAAILLETLSAIHDISIRDEITREINAC